MATPAIQKIVDRALKNLSRYEDHVVSWGDRETVIIHDKKRVDEFADFMISTCIRTLVCSGMIEPSGQRIKVSEIKATTTN